ncbi:Inherit from COG: Methyltransferase [Seminavis robusta]|uniref:Inherit from COG: Methyltransferase n=1 Tax=Seminavis robusta TaxID=568900 RepID=A0A9N8E9R6_9STRA|nr:Inherit from COG: Methyltransferase [Seminavis robusta]|eukprot:Sro854_g211260.1 Inherit from COG: Methyltransferase (390) ;mRNA; f:33166-34335
MAPSKLKKRGGSNPKWWVTGSSIFALLSGFVVFSLTSPADIQPFFVADAIRRMSEEGSLDRHSMLNDTNSISTNKYPPVSCSAALEEVRAEGNGEMDPNKGVLHGKTVQMGPMYPKFWISLHDVSFDPTRWHVMDYGEYYEKALSRAFAEVLKDTPAGSRVIDVGGNIGFFTMLSAANGPVVVDTFEPNQKNRLRVCESSFLNHWHSEFNKDFVGDAKQRSKINIYPYGVGRLEGVFSFHEHSNPGQGRVSEQLPGTAPDGNALHVITLDNFARERGWFTTRPDIAILKVDVEGFEYSVIEGAAELLKAKIIRNLFMEVSAREKWEMEINKPALKLVFQSGYKLHKIGAWRGPNNDVSFPQDDNIAEHVMQRTLKEKSQQLNLWWKLDD